MVLYRFNRRINFIFLFSSYHSTYPNLDLGRVENSYPWLPYMHGLHLVHWYLLTDAHSDLRHGCEHLGREECPISLSPAIFVSLTLYVLVCGSLVYIQCKDIPTDSIYSGICKMLPIASQSYQYCSAMKCSCVRTHILSKSLTIQTYSWEI